MDPFGNLRRICHLRTSLPPTYNSQLDAFSMTQRRRLLKEVIALKDAGVPDDIVRSTMGDFGDIVDSVFRTTTTTTTKSSVAVNNIEP